MSRTKDPRPLSPEQRTKLETADYEVGFGKTPKTSRFQPGQSGNPSGRPKGKTISTLFEELLDQSINTSANGAPQRMSVREAVVQIIGVSGLKGSARDREFLIRMIEKYLPHEFQEPPKKRLTPNQLDTLRRLKERAL